MFGRKKKREDPSGQSFQAMTVPGGSPGLSYGPENAGPTMDRLRVVTPEILEALRHGQQGLDATVVRTSITQNGQQVDPDSPEGRELLELLTRMGTLPPQPQFPQPAPMAKPSTPVVDQGAVAMALQQAQADPQKLPQVIALVDDYVHGRIPHDRFESERRRIVGY